MTAQLVPVAQIPVVHGREVELQKSATHIQWRFVGTTEWIDLVPLTELRGEDGTDGQDGTLGPRSDAVFTTGSLAVDAHETGVIPMGPGWRLYRIQTSVPARVRLYASLAQRDADLARGLGGDPVGDHGLMFEYATVAHLLSSGLSPLVDGAVLGFTGLAQGEVPITVTNRSTSTAAVTVTLTWAKTE